MPLEYNCKELLLNFDKTKNNILFITRQKLDYLNNLQLEPKSALINLYHNQYEYVVIYSLNTFDKIYGYLLEIILEHSKNTSIIIYINYFTNFSKISNYLDHCQIINIPSVVDYNIIGYKRSKNDFMFEMKLNYKILPFINRKTLIYCVTKKNCINTIEHIYKEYAQENNVNESRSFDDEMLNVYISSKISYYHSDLSDRDKETVLAMYETNEIEILISTQSNIKVKCDTLFIKSTKEYSKNGYQEISIDLLIQLMRNIKENGTIYVMTTKDKNNYYKRIFLHNKCVDYQDVLNNDFKPYFNFSSLEHHIPEYILFKIYYEKKTLEIIKSDILKSFFHFQLGVNSSQLNQDELFHEIIMYLEKSRLFNNGQIDVNLVNLFMCSNYSLETYVKIIGLKGNEESILETILQCTEFNFKEIKLQAKKKENIFNSLLNIEKPEYINKLIRFLDLSVKIKEYLKINLSDVIILLSKLNTKEHFKKSVEKIVVKDNIISNKNLNIKYTENKLQITNNICKTYHLIIEKFEILLDFKIINGNLEIEINQRDVNVFCISTDDCYKNLIFHITKDKITTKDKNFNAYTLKNTASSNILKYTENKNEPDKRCLKLNTNDQNQAELKNKPSKTQSINFNDNNENKKRNIFKMVKKEIRNIGQIKLELFTPDNITLPKWFK